MGKVIITDTYLSNIADAIRNKTGTQITYTPSQMASAINNIPSGGSGWTTTLLTSQEVTDSYTSTSAATLTTVTSATTASLVSDNKILYVKVRDKAGKRTGYFYGSDTLIYPYKSSATAYSSVLMRVIYRVSTAGLTIAYAASTSTGYGVYASAFATGTGNITISHRYSSTYSLTINGTYKIEVYSMSIGENIWDAVT